MTKLFGSGSSRSGAKRPGRWRKTASASALALVAGTLVVLALQNQGKPFTEVKLNDGGVWVTNKQDGLVARVNPQIKQLDLGVDASSADFDVFQRATDLYLDDDSGERAVKPIDIVRAALQDPTDLPSEARTTYGGGTFAIVDAMSGKAWVRTQATLKGFSPKAVPPAGTDVLAATVGTDGTAYLLDRDGTVTSYSVDADGTLQRGDQVTLDHDLGTDPDRVSLTVVGTTPVLYNQNDSELSRPGGQVEIDAADPTKVALQQPSAGGDKVYVATEHDLESADLGGGGLTKISRGPVSGAPAAPVYLDSARCVYAAWADPSSPNNYLRDCADDQYDDVQRIKHMQPGAELEFRVNRDVVVLNDSYGGDTWLVQDPGKALINNWPQVDPKNENVSKLKKTTTRTPPQENRPPEPQDDDLGARPGRTTVLPVVALNDHDPDGDIISIKKTQYVGGPDVQVRIVGGGTQLQVAVPAGAVGTAVFRYYVTDGKVNQEPWATVHLHIRKSAQHVKPQKMPDRNPELDVTTGATSSYYLLADFYDYDGDDLTLTDASSKGGEVEFRPDGTITFTDNGDGKKNKEIDYTIEDGFDTITGKLPVKVLGDAAPPELVPDLASGVAGQRVVVQPLSNDRNPDGSDLALKTVKVVGNDAGTQITKDLEAGTFTFDAQKAKSYYLQYSAYNKSATETSTVRLDIESPPKNNRPPIAVGDKVVLPVGGTAQVDLLLNDFDPDGDVLAVTRIGEPNIAGIKVSVVDKRLAVVSAASDFTGQEATVPYTVSDGRSTAQGSLVIAQRQTSDTDRRPVANKDQVTVRAGSITTIPVLDNDSDPDGPKPRLFQSDLINEQKLDIWVSGDTLRLKAPDKPGTYSVIYGERDTDGLKASAEVSVYVIADSAKNNHPPMPQPIIDRVIAGRPKDIPVDLTGADPDGDTVSFKGILTAPTHGRILDTGIDWIRYEAFPGMVGTDFFQIVVQDKYGATGVAEVRVGVVPPGTENQAPVALDDSVLVQPGRTISYNVLGNDIDPDDDPLRITAVNSTAKAKFANGFIEVPSGDAPKVGSTETNVGYTISDAAGATDNAVLKVVTSHDAPFYAPIAHDDVADLGDIIGKKPGASVEIPVLDNDLDFDGAKADLHVTDCDAGAHGHCDVIDGGTQVKVRLMATDQIVLYKLDDADDQSPSTYGVIYVTGTDNVPPQLTTDSHRVPVKVDENGHVAFDLKDLVVTRAGREPRLVPDSLPTSVNGAVNPVKGSPTSLDFTPTKKYVGPASVTVDVSDGRTVGESAALTSLLTIPIQVEPVGNVPPAMRDAGVTVTSHEDVEVDLAGLTTDANDGDLAAMTYAVDSVDPGVSARLTNKSIVKLRAAGGAKDDADLKVGVSAKDPKGGIAHAVIAVRVVGTNRPLMTIPPIPVTGEKGKRQTVDLASVAVNPYPGQSFDVHDPKVSGTGHLTDVQAKGTVVSFTPETTGVSTIKAEVTDASKDPKRDVVAQIIVTVIAKPDPPTRPVVSSVEADSAVLSWAEPEANGAPITSYQVEGSAGFTQTCAATTCNLTGLTPGQTYSFTVRAVNSQGPSDPSPPSQSVVPNKAPDIMTPPTIVVAPTPTGTAMDRRLTVRWTPPNNDGSAITSYEIKEAGSTQTWTAGGGDTSKTITGLSNGTPYVFEIRAINSVTPYRDFSGPSKAVAPFGKPVRTGAAPTFSASQDDDYTHQPWVRVDWSAWGESQSNGNNVTGYVVRCVGCNQGTYVLPASATSKTFDSSDGIRKGKLVTLSIAATNDAGTGDFGPTVSGQPWTRSSPVQNLHEVGSSPADGVAVLDWNQPDDLGGLPFDHYLVQWDGGSQRVDNTPDAGGVRINFGTNGSHHVTVVAVTSNGGKEVDGDGSDIGSVVTWGKPFAPDSRDVLVDYYKVYMALSAGQSNGQSVTGLQYKGPDDADWQDAGKSFTYSHAVNQGGATYTIQVRTVSSAADDDPRKYSDPVSLTGTSKARTFNVTLNGGCKNKPDNDCWIGVSGAGFDQSNPTTLTITYNGMSPEVDGNGASTCPATQDVQGSFATRFGSSCLVTGSGSITISADGGTSDTAGND